MGESIDDNIEYFILKGLFDNYLYSRKVIFNLEEKYFSSANTNIIKFIKKFYLKYGKSPAISMVLTKLLAHPKLSDDHKEDIEEVFTELDKMEFDSINQQDWLYDETKAFAQREAVKNAIYESLALLDDRDQIDTIVENIRKSVSQNWDEDLGLDYFEELDERYERLATESEVVVSSGIPALDAAIGGGFRKKTINLFGGPSGVGKTLVLGNLTAEAMKQNLNVIYFTLEIDKDLMGKRIDSVLLKHNIDDLIKNQKTVLTNLKGMAKEGTGRLLIKEFPASITNKMHLENYLTEVAIKKNFIPDVIVVDYLGLMRPNESVTNQSSNERGKFISEELRSLAFVYDCPLLTAVQTGRQSFGSSDVKASDTADSISIVHTADSYVTLAKPEELDKKMQLMGTVVKSRAKKEGTKMIIQLDYNQMRMHGMQNKAEREDDDGLTQTEKVKKAMKKHKKHRNALTD
jgi:replicative DNA helicase